MNSKKMYWLLSGSILVLILALVGGVYQMNAMLKKESGKLVSNKAKLATLHQEQTELVKAKQDIARYQQLYQIARTVVPQNKDQAQTVRQIVKLAQENGITLASITFPVSSLGSGAAGTAAGGTAAPTPSAAAGQSATSGANPSLSQLKAVPQISGVYLLQLTVEGASDAGKLTTYPALINFLSDLEQNRLTALVSNIEISPLKSGTGQVSTVFFSFKLTLDVYIKPGK